jgi:5'-nucleotidase
VICLSDLGPSGRGNALNDQLFAQTSEHIDMIIGNDNGKFPNNDMVLRNKLKHEVIFSAAASEGLTLGKTIVTFNKDKQKNGLALEQIVPGQPASQNYGAALRELSFDHASRQVC